LSSSCFFLSCTTELISPKSNINKTSPAKIPL
jgi:hypothetical protein